MKQIMLCLRGKGFEKPYFHKATFRKFTRFTAEKSLCVEELPKSILVSGCHSQVSLKFDFEEKIILYSLF